MRRTGLGLALALAGGLAPRALADPPPRERFLRDGDARSLAASLASSADPRDREDRDLALLAVDPAARPPAGASPLVLAAQALREGDLAGARAAVAGDAVARGPAGAVLVAAVKVRAGEDEGAARALLDAPPIEDARDEATLALLGRSLPPDDRRFVGGAARLAMLRAASSGSLDGVECLAATTRAFDPASFPATAVLASRALRRGGAPERAEALLASRAPSPSDPADLRLERALLAWRTDGARTATEAAARGETSVPGWAFAALVRADGPASVPPPPGPLHVHEDDLHAAALARLATLSGVAATTGEVVARATAQRTSASDPRFARDWLTRAGLSAVELAGDPEAVRLALSRGLPVLLHRVGRRGDAFREQPFVVRAHDAATGLLLGEPFDLGALDVLPADAPAKARILVAAPVARAADLAPLRARPSAAVGAAVAEALASAAAAAGGTSARSAALGSPPALDVYLAFLLYPAAVDGREGEALAEVRAAVARSSSWAPVTPFESYVQALGAPDVDRAVAGLDAALDAAGEAAWLRTARFVTLAGARRTGEALAELERALALDPLDTRALYFRASTRRLLGDRAAARADLARVLDRRPAYLAAVEDLVRMLVDDGRAREALAALEAFERADRKAASSERVRSLRRGAEVALVRRAGSAADLRAFVGSPEPETRRKVAVALAGLEGDESEAALRGLLADADEGVRVTAVRGYLRPWLRARVARDEALLGALARLLADDPAETVRSAAATVLGSLEAPAARAAVSARLTGPSRDASPSVRAAAADALSGRDAPESRAALVAALSDDDVEVRRAAIASLHRIAAKTFDYVPDDPPDRRRPCVAQWEAWAREPR